MRVPANKNVCPPSHRPPRLLGCPCRTPCHPLRRSVLISLPAQLRVNVAVNNSEHQVMNSQWTGVLEGGKLLASEP